MLRGWLGRARAKLVYWLRLVTTPVYFLEEPCWFGAEPGGEGSAGLIGARRDDLAPGGGYQVAVEIAWRGVPNGAMRPRNLAAWMRLTTWRWSLPRPPSKPVQLPMIGLPTPVANEIRLPAWLRLPPPRSERWRYWYGDKS